MMRKASRAGELFSGLDRDFLQRAAGERSFERGEDYFASGQVMSLVEDSGTVAAKVRGTRPYRVKLWAEDGEIRHSCTCPVGEEGAFCKHCVAVGLAWLSQERGVAPASKRKPAKPTVTMEEVRVWLLQQNMNALIDMIVDEAMVDDRLRRRLLLNAAKVSSKGIDPHSDLGQGEGASGESEEDAGSGRRSMRSKKLSSPLPPSLREAFYLIDKKGRDKKRGGLCHDVYDNKWVTYKSLSQPLLFSIRYTVEKSANRLEPRPKPRCL